MIYNKIILFIFVIVLSADCPEMYEEYNGQCYFNNDINLPVLSLTYTSVTLTKTDNIQTQIFKHKYLKFKHKYSNANIQTHIFKHTYSSTNI